MRRLSCILISSLLTLTSCQERGCNDLFAVNYEDSVNKNDGSCRYEAKLSFIYSESSQAFVDDGGSILLDIDGVEYPIYDHDQMASFMDCVADHIIIDLERAIERSLSYTIRQAEAGGELTTTSSQVIVRANQCQVVEI